MKKKYSEKEIKSNMEFIDRMFFSDFSPFTIARYRLEQKGLTVLNNVDLWFEIANKIRIAILNNNDVEALHMNIVYKNESQIIN